MTDIFPLDLHFQGNPHGIAAYLLRGPAGNVLIEVGPGSTLPYLQAGLAAHGLAPADIAAVLVTHIHLDHAGSAGWWARQGVPIHVHHLGAPHLVDPERLLTSARRIYLDQMDTLWGEFLASPADRVFAHHDGDVIEAAGLRLIAHDTPGHARHHLVYQLGDVAFVGDLAGVRRPESRYLRLPTPPPEFDLPAWLASVARMRALNFQAIYLTHFGPLTGPAVAAHWDQVSSLLPQYAGLVQTGLAASQDRDTLVAHLAAWEAERLIALGVPHEQLPIYDALGPNFMAVDGLLRYWQKQARPPA
ncbi:MAG: MBL fold metallo-hydrolase [Anaerolineales bacterium]|nr:MBL fold metallo-hydrolase [Anaerolineales bacterium]